MLGYPGAKYRVNGVKRGPLRWARRGPALAQRPATGEKVMSKRDDLIRARPFAKDEPPTVASADWRLQAATWTTAITCSDRCSKVRSRDTGLGFERRRSPGSRRRSLAAPGAPGGGLVLKALIAYPVRKMGKVGFEPTRACARSLLRRLRRPFRHFPATRGTFASGFSCPLARRVTASALLRRPSAGERARARHRKRGRSCRPCAPSDPERGPVARRRSPSAVRDRLAPRRRLARRRSPVLAMPGRTGRGHVRRSR